MLPYFKFRDMFFYLICFAGIVTMLGLLYNLRTDNQLKQVNSHPHQELESSKSHQPGPAESLPAPSSPPVLTVENRILVIRYDLKRQPSDSILVALHYCRFEFKAIDYNQARLPRLFNEDTAVGLYSVIVFQDLKTYISMSETFRTRLDEYCRKYGVGIVYFMSSKLSKLTVSASILDFPLSYSTGVPVKLYSIPKSSLASIVRTDVVHEFKDSSDWVIYHPNHPTYETFGYGSSSKENKATMPVGLLDKGGYDGIRRVFFGNNHAVWLHKILFLDALDCLTHGALRIGKEKLIQVDIDDMLLGANGTKMNAQDVQVTSSAAGGWSVLVGCVVMYNAAVFRLLSMHSEFGERTTWLASASTWVWWDTATRQVYYRSRQEMRK